jgi:hypothetical protein
MKLKTLTHLRMGVIAFLISGWLIAVHFNKPDIKPDIKPVISQPPTKEAQQLHDWALFTTAYYEGIKHLGDSDPFKWGDEAADALLRGDMKKYKSMLDADISEIKEQQQGTKL